MNPCHMEGPEAFSEVQEGREQNSGLVKDRQGMGCGCGKIGASLERVNCEKGLEQGIIRKAG